MKRTLLSLACLCFAAGAQATILYGTTGAGGSNNSNLITIDLATGSTTVIGSIGYNVNGLTYDSSTNTLFGSASSDVGLLSINTTTGAGSLIGSGFNSPSIGCSDRNVLLTSNSSGALFGWCDPSSDDLMSINKATGQATAIVGDSGLSTGAHGI